MTSGVEHDPRVASLEVALAEARARIDVLVAEVERSQRARRRPLFRTLYVVLEREVNALRRRHRTAAAFARSRNKDRSAQFEAAGVTSIAEAFERLKDLRAAQQETQQLRERIADVIFDWKTGADVYRASHDVTRKIEAARMQYCAEELEAALAAAPEPQETKK